MRKPCITISLITIIICADICRSVPIPKSSSSLQAKINPYYIKAMAAYKKLQPKLPREELRALTTIGILNGVKQAEQQMEKNLIKVVKDLLLNTNMSDNANVLPKIEKIEAQLDRDQKSLEILTKALDMATKTKDSKTFKKEMQDLLESLKKSSSKTVNKNSESDVGQRVAMLRQQILKQVDMMKNVVDDKIDQTLDYLIEHANADGLLAKASNKVIRKRQVEKEEPARIRQIKSILTEDDFRNNLVEIPISNNEDDSLEDDNLLLAATNVIETNSNTPSTPAVALMINLPTAAVGNAVILPTAAAGNAVILPTAAAGNTVILPTTAAGNTLILAQQEEGSFESLGNDNGDEAPAGGGGLVGIITSLSGGEGGSDIGALIGALTGVISQIFGPGGLDIESLISSATALISGLLSGNKNFGTVLGTYVGNAFDGFSGGGGAINNGQFIGNFLGTVVASLSADPEEDDVPPKPLIFLQNLFSSFIEAKNRQASGEESSERKDKKKEDNNNKGGSDSTVFIKHIVSHVVGGVVSLILNASLGASGGASHASSSLFGASSSGHKPHL